MNFAPNAGQLADPSEKSGARVAELIKEEVLQGRLPRGRLIGSEQELMRRFGVSRSTLREGVRQLEAHGLVRMCRGSGGGLVVSGMPEDIAVRALATYLELIDAGLEELFEARKVLEVSAAGLAAEKARDGDIRTLRALLDELLAHPPAPANIRYHVAVRECIAHCSGNPALALFISALSRFTVESVVQTSGLRGIESEYVAAVEAKREIVFAIVGGNRADAESAMRTDLELRLRVLRTGAPPPTSTPTPLVRRTGFEPKLGQLVALRIAHRIVQGELREGARLGSERDLLVQYSVSRAVFREAIRILELHGFVHTRRGFGGGLVVSTPDPGYAVTTAMEYLRHWPMDLSHLDEVRRIVSIATAQMAAERRDEPSLAALRQIYETQRRTTGSAKVEAALAFHLKLADLCGNRALGLMLKVLLHVAWSMRPQGHSAPRGTALDESHQALLEAIEAGDGALARRRMTEHVDRAGAWLAQRRGST